MRTTVILLFIATGSLLGAASAYAEDHACSNGDRIKLAIAGYTKMEIESMCGASAALPPLAEHWGILAGEGQARWVQWCVTPQGRCSINPTVMPFPPGIPCNCYWPWGFYGGVSE